MLYKWNYKIDSSRVIPYLGLRNISFAMNFQMALIQMLQVALLMVIDGNLLEKSLLRAAIDTATWRATAL